VSDLLLKRSRIALNEVYDVVCEGRIDPKVPSLVRRLDRPLVWVDNGGLAAPHSDVLAHGFQTALKNGPAAPELRRDAHDCIMVVILTDQPNTRLRGKSAPDRELPSELSLLARTTSPDQHSLPPCS
jgi:hypothetical protein